MIYSDYISARNPPVNLTPSQIEPTFEVVRQTDAYYALVLDTSGSMVRTAQRAWVILVWMCHQC